MNKKQYLIGIVFMLISLFLDGCNNSVSRARERENALKEIRGELENLKLSLPFKILSTDIWMTSLELEDSLLTCTCEMNKEDWNIYSMPEKEANSDRNIARIIKSFDPQMRHLLEKHNLGFKYVYTDKEAKQILMSISISPSTIKGDKNEIG